MGLADILERAQRKKKEATKEKQSTSESTSETTPTSNHNGELLDKMNLVLQEVKDTKEILKQIQISTPLNFTKGVLETAKEQKKDPLNALISAGNKELKLMGIPVGNVDQEVVIRRALGSELREILSKKTIQVASAPKQNR